MLGLSIASSILLGAALAPTDPVLASDVQVGPPNSTEEDDVRFALTSEAGLNDGLSFPFVYLAIAIALSLETGAPWFADWFVFDVLWKLSSGLLIGWLTGAILGHLTFRVSRRAQISRTNDGMVAIGITLLCYGLTELAHGYGFVAVFVAALTLRSVERRHSYHHELHAFTEQVEQTPHDGHPRLLWRSHRGRFDLREFELAGGPCRNADHFRHTAPLRDAQSGLSPAALGGEGCDRLLRNPRTGIILLPGVRLRSRPVRQRQGPLGHPLLHGPRFHHPAWCLGDICDALP